MWRPTLAGVTSAWIVGLAGLVGLLTGVLGMLSFRRSEVERARLAMVPEPELPPGLTEVLAVLRSAAILLDAGQEVSTASPAAYAFGLVRGHDLVHSELHDMATEARRLGVVRERELELPRGPLGLGRIVVNARVAPLGSEYVLVLVDDRTEARRVEEVRRDFVANVSHELKTPIGALKLLAEAVANGADDPDAVQHFAARMEREAQRLATLVQEIIDLSRLQVADALHAPEPVGLDVVLAEAVDRVRLAAQKKQIGLSMGGDLGAIVYGDRDLLVTAVRNLIDNAIAYSPEGTRVDVVVRRADNLVEIAVKDQGYGIPKSDLERIFERFYRVDPARSRATGGTGLGLSIVKHIAANHGGEVTVWSQEGVGSTFTLRLPDSAHAAATADGAPSSPAVLTDPPISPVVGLPLHADPNGLPAGAAAPSITTTRGAPS